MIFLFFFFFFFFFLRPVYHDPNAHFDVKYDLFISFRGEDVRKTLLSNLTEALRGENIDVFTDERIQKGEEIGPALIQAIEKSSISLVLFSPNFFNSEWCLIELVKINECRDKYGQIVIPVFVNITPTEVRNQTGKCAKSFSAFVKKYGAESKEVKEVISALTSIANIKGCCLSSYKDEAEFIKDIVISMKTLKSTLDGILEKKRLSKRIGHVNQISHVESLLMADSKDVCAIGIWGMPGSGKTTTAEEVYVMIHCHFEASCYKHNVGEEWRKHGRLNLERKIYSDLLPNLDIVDDAERMLRGMKVLVVLDGVNDLQQLNYLIGSTLNRLGKGSRIIITTRDKQILTKWVDDNDVHEVKPLDFDDSFQLFNLHAFDQNHPKFDNYELFKEMVYYYAQGNPLFLKELGQFFGGKDKRTWKSEFEKLAREPSLLKNVYDAIKLSYNDLNRVEKKVLLDIASLSDGLHLKVDNIRLPMNVDNLQLLLKDGGGYNLVDVDVLHSLKNKGLLTISQHNVVSMYVIIQVIARKISLEESKQTQLLQPNDKRMSYILVERSTVGTISIIQN